MTMENNDGHMPDLGRPQSAARAWFEPLLVVSIMLASLYFNRDRSFSFFPSRDARGDDASESLMKSNGYGSSRSSSRSTSPDREESRPDTPTSPWQHDLSPRSLETRSSLNFASRILQKFPFLVEMFYWVLNYAAYALTKKIGAALYSEYGGNQVTELAQDHAIDILTFEHDTPFRIFFPVTEVAFQLFYLDGHLRIMTFFNQIYSLVHIPGTVAYLSWFYYAAPSHEIFAIARRTMTLGNFSAFVIFSFYPCMPPRLLPESFGFKDTVRQEHAESVWTGGNNVNQLAAMPSLHFTYAFVIGCTFLFQSGVLQACKGHRAAPKSALKSFAYIVAGVLYPLLVLSVIIATGNHFWLDAVVATFSVTVCFFANRAWLVLLPLEKLFCWIVRLRKPVPTTAKGRTAERPRIVIDYA